MRTHVSIWNANRSNRSNRKVRNIGFTFYWLLEWRLQIKRFIYYLSFIRVGYSLLTAQTSIKLIELNHLRAEFHFLISIRNECERSLTLHTIPSMIPSKTVSILFTRVEIIIETPNVSATKCSINYLMMVPNERLRGINHVTHMQRIEYEVFRGNYLPFNLIVCD